MRDSKDGNDRTVLFLLGKTKPECSTTDSVLASPDAWRFAIDTSSAVSEEIVQSVMIDQGQQDVVFASPRSLMGTLNDRAALAVAGAVAARLTWHEETRIKTNRRTVPTGLGHRRVDEADESLVSYPRTDPVVIMLVESKDGQRCLLGRTARRADMNMYSCLAGFVEMSESVEDAVIREVAEESGVHIACAEDVRIIGSQPWPIGASGHSELMLGCIATASEECITINACEMDDVRWISKEEARRLLSRSKKKGSIGDASKPMVVPPPYAIAHHLIHAWAHQDGQNLVGPSRLSASSPGAFTTGMALGATVTGGFASLISGSFVFL